MFRSHVERDLNRLSRCMLRMELYAIEVTLTVCSLWAASCLLTPPSNFAANANSWAFLQSMQIHETTWGLLAAGGAITKAVGLALLLFDFLPALSLLLRCTGLAISGFLWSVIGVSFLLGNSDSVASIPLIMLGASSWWTLVRFPCVPKHLSP